MQSKLLDDDTIDKFWSRLREDASERGMLDLAIAYGWCQIRRRQEILEQQAAKFR